MHDVGGRVQRFEIVAHLGAGGMGTVLRAHDPQLERDVAIKLLTHSRPSVPGLSQHETMDLRSAAPATADDLLREARMMARLSHPNVLPVYEVGLADDTVFVVMEHIDGAELRTWARDKSKREIIDVLAQAARGLVAAHAQEIVHGDFKPENVLVGHDRRVRVADFGLAQLTQPSHTMRRLDTVGGTPRYMAPELWVGERPSRASDVYAFCVTAADVLGAKLDDIERTLDLPGRLRRAILSGLVDNPQRRPPLATILGELEQRSSVPAWLLAASAIALVAIGGTAFVLSDSDDESCTIDRSVEGSWSPARAFALRHALRPANPTPADQQRLARILANFDEAQADVDRAWLGTCRAVRAGELTASQAEVKRSCVTRRQIELAVKVSHFIAHSRADRLGAIVERARIPDSSDCEGLTTPPLPLDREPVIALYRRLIDLEIVPTAKRAAATIELGREAAALGERELEVRTSILAGTWNSDAGQLELADQQLERGYKQAIELHYVRLQAMALIMRSRNATKRGDVQTALSLGKLALEIADRGTAGTFTRARVYAELGRAALERDDAAMAIAMFDKGLAAIAKDGHRLPFIEGSLRIDRTRAFGRFEGKKQEGLASARESAKWMADTFGPRSMEAANGLEQVASFQRWSGDNAGALATYEQVYKLKLELQPDDPSLALARGNLAQYYEYNGRYEEARKLYARELVDAEHNELVKSYIPLILVRLGVNTCAVGRCDEGYPMIERGVELGISQYGDDSGYVQGYRDDLLQIQLELGKLAGAERTLDAMRRAWSIDKQRHARSLVMLNGHESTLVLMRGNARHAEKLAREALAAWDELKGDDVPRSGLMGMLAQALIGQRKFAEAKPLVEQGLAIAKANQLSAESIAHQEIRLAEIEAGLGHVAEAKELAKRAREALTPMSNVARGRADAVLGR